MPVLWKGRGLLSSTPLWAHHDHVVRYGARLTEVRAKGQPCSMETGVSTPAIPCLFSC